MNNTTTSGAYGKFGYFEAFFSLVVILAIFNIFVLKSAIFGLILAVYWLFGLISGVLGARFGKSSINIVNSSIGLIIGLSLIVVLASIFFYIFNLGQISILIIFLIINALLLIVGYSLRIRGKFVGIKIDKSNLIFYVLYSIFFIISLGIILASQSDSAIRSPWEVMPNIFFIIYFFLTTILILIIFRCTDKKNNLILLSLHFLLTLIISVLVYIIGYGFDPFVHRAAELKLAELGYILPKPLYYIGQYSLVVFLSKIFFVPIVLMDKLLVPAMAALTLPAMSYGSLKKYIKNNSLLLVSCSLLLVLATPLFFYTVPQSMANLFLIILIFLLFGNELKFWHWLLAAAIFLIHPLAGIPAFILISLKGIKANKILKRARFILASILIPLFFIFASALSDFKIRLSLTNFSNLTGLFKDTFTYLPFYSLYHLLYLIDDNWLLIFIAVLIIGFIYLFRSGHKKLVINNLQLAAILIINLILLGFIKFSSVIDYEQAEFLKRLGQIILLALAPIFLIGVYYILDKTLSLKGGRWMIVFLVSGILSISLYLSYPHSDAFVKNRGFSVSQSDIDAVHLIDFDSNGDNYIVLANQSTSAASLQEFGFKKYYTKCQGSSAKCQNLFYYPIPTSSPLYDIYLKMVYDRPRLKYINEARNLTGADRVYFVINNYWLDSKKRAGQAKNIADWETNIDNQLWIFRFGN